MKNVKDQILAILKGVRTKQGMIDVVKGIKKTDLTEEGNLIKDYLLNSAFIPSEMDSWNLTDMRNEVVTLLDGFKADKQPVAIFENSVKSKPKTLTKKTVNKSNEYEATEEEIEAVNKAINTKKKDTKKDDKLSAEEIVKLCGYRYTYPEFPKTFTTPYKEGKVFTRVDSNDINEVFSMWEEADDEEEALVCVMYFPEYERDFEIDPHGVMNSNVSRKTLLKQYGGKYPLNLDIQTIFHMHAPTRAMCSVSAYTGIPYATALQQAWFETNDRLKCRVTQNGLDYQFYKMTDAE